MRIRPKFKEGDAVGIMHEGRKYTGKVFVVDMTDRGYRYDVMCSKPEKLIIKHIFEDELLGVHP